MFKSCRILNKNTNIIFYGQIDTEFEGKDFYELIEIPDDEKLYIFQSGLIMEKPASLDVLKQQKITEIEKFYSNSFLKGLDTSIGIKFHIKPEDQLNYIGAMIATASLQDSDILPFSMIDFNGNVHQIKKAQANTAYIEIVNYKAQMEVKRAILLNQVENATIENIEEIICQ